MLYSILKHKNYLIISLIFFINLEVDAFTVTTLERPKTLLFASFFNSKACDNINFINDSNIYSLIPRQFCITEDEQDSIDICLSNILSSEERSKDLLSVYSYEITSKLTSLLPFVPEIEHDVLKKINCYSETYLKLNDKKKWLSKDVAHLFADILPLLYLKSKNSINPENLDVWDGFIQEIQESFGPVDLLKITENKKFQFYLISILFDEKRFNQLDEVDKYNLTLKILSLAHELEVTVPNKTATVLVDYLMKRNIEWDFPSQKLLTDYSYDILFQPTLIKSIEKMNLDSKNTFETYNSVYPFFKQSNALLETKCSIANFFVKAIVSKAEYSDEDSKIIESLLELKLNCRAPHQEDLLQALPYSQNFIRKWCPKHKLCQLHFSNSKWLSDFSSCSSDKECKSIKSENCNRIFFNMTISRQELALYTLHCEKYSKNPILNLGPIEPACIDNLCKGRQ